MSSPTQRTKKLLQDLGWSVHNAERWNPFAHIRQDMFGFIDLLAISDDETMGVQATAGAVANRLEKSKAQPVFNRWIKSRRFIVIGWTLKGARGKRKVYKPRIVEVYRDGGERTWRDEEIQAQEAPAQRPKRVRAQKGEMPQNPKRRTDSDGRDL